MTDVLDVGLARPGSSRPRRPQGRPGQQPPARRRRQSPLWLRLAGPVAKATVIDVAVALVTVEVVTLIAWAADSRAGSGATEAVRLGAAIWLSGLRARIHAGPAVIGIPPLGLTFCYLALVARSAAGIFHDVAERPMVDLARLAAGFGVAYGAGSAVIAVAADTQSLHPSPLTAGVGGLAVGFLGAGWGMLRARRRAGVATLRQRLPQAGQTMISAALTALAAMTIVAAVIPAVLLIAHHKLAGDLSHSLAPGSVGSVALILLQVLLAPLLVVGGFSWLAGPGFAVGAGTSVTPWTTTLGPLPALPILAALPNGGTHLGVVVLAVPLLCGLLAGFVLLRGHGAPRWWEPFALAAGAAVIAGLIACVVSYAAGGPGGPGRLETVGPSGVLVGLAFAAEVFVGCSLVALGHLAWRTREETYAGLRVVGGGASHGLKVAGSGTAQGLKVAGSGAGHGLKAAGGGSATKARAVTERVRKLRIRKP